MSQVKSAYYVFKMKPRPKERPRASKGRNGQIFMRTSAVTEQYESLIKRATEIQHPQHGPLQGDLSAFIQFYLENRIHGDADNLAKSVLDGMQGVAFANDKQILTLFVDLHFISEGAPGEPRIEVTICRREPDDWSDWTDTLSESEAQQTTKQ